MAAPHLSASVVHDDLVYISGQLPIRHDGTIPDGIVAQTEQVFANLQAVLAQHALSLRDVLKTTVFVVRAQDFPALNEAYASAFGDHKPVRSTVVAGLVAPAALIEIDAIPVLGRR